MKIGVIGFPQSGKTALIEGLAAGEKSHEEQTPPQKKSKQSLITLKVPDPRLKIMSDFFNASEIKEAEVSFFEIGGFGVSSGLSGETILQLKESDGLALVLRIFSGQEWAEEFSPSRIFKSIEDELILQDLKTVENRLERLKKDLKSGKDVKLESEILFKCQHHLEEAKTLKSLPLRPDEEKFLRGFQFLTQKPVFLIANVSEEDLNKPLPEELVNLSSSRGLEIVNICAKLEWELARLSEEEAKVFSEELGLKERSRDKCLQSAYRSLGLVTFFTIKKEEEIRAWPIKTGTKAIDAAGKVHSDMEKGFIRAEAVNFSELSKFESASQLRQQAALRLEGKDYTVQDGDIITFRFSV